MDGRDRLRLRRPAPWAGLLLIAGVVSACGTAVQVSADPLSTLQDCGESPYVAVFRGFTEDGFDAGPASSDLSQIYAARSDGSIERITEKPSVYDFDISSDASTIYLSPYPTIVGPVPAPPDPGTPPPATIDQLSSIDTRTAESRLLLELPEIAGPASSPDGTQLAMVVSNNATQDLSGNIATLSLISSEPLQILPAASGVEGSSVRNLRWAPGGKALAYTTILSDGRRQVRVRDLASGAERVIYDASGSLSSLDWSQDGRLLLVAETRFIKDEGDVEGRVVQIEVATGRSEVALDALSASPAYSKRDGSAIIALTTREDGQSMIQTWTRMSDGAFELTSEAQVGRQLGLVGTWDLRIATCAVA